MGSIKKIEIIDRMLLNEENYLESLIGEACRLNLLTDNDVEKIQHDCIQLLANKTEKYNGLDSSSIRIEIAQNIMKSNLYTISIWLKTYPCPDDALRALKESKLSELYEKGRKKITSKQKAIKAFHSKVIKNLVETKNYIYNATLIDGIKGFFKIYNPDYEAHDIRITADYPLSNPVINFVGIEFIQEYLNSVHYENTFCRNFSPEDIHHLLYGYDKKYKDLIINIYEFVLSAAIGCIIAKSDVSHLYLSKENIDYLYNTLSGKSRIEIENIVLNSFCELKERFQINSGLQEQYIKKSLSAISFNVHNALNLKTLDKVFIVAKNEEFVTKTYFSFGKKMDNERYRKIVEKIMQCGNVKDKISIIKAHVKSLADLADILLDAELSEEEIISILSKLNPAEIAALSRKYPYKSGIDAFERRESEQELSRCLNKYVIRLTPKQQEWLAKAVESLDCKGM